MVDRFRYIEGGGGPLYFWKVKEGGSVMGLACLFYICQSLVLATFSCLRFLCLHMPQLFVQHYILMEIGAFIPKL